MAKKWGRRLHCLFLMADLDSTSVKGSVAYPAYFYISLFEVRIFSFSLILVRKNRSAKFQMVCQVYNFYKFCKYIKKHCKKMFIQNILPTVTLKSSFILNQS